MGRLKRGEFIFVWWKGDHSPRHVHVCRDGTLVVKWDLENQKPMAREAPRVVLELIMELVAEGRL